jgi:hypothetical protein
LTLSRLPNGLPDFNLTKEKEKKNKKAKLISRDQPAKLIK